MSPRHKLPQNRLTKCRRALSLTELILAMLLLVTVLLTATTFNLASFNFYFDSNKYVQTQTILATALEQIAKEVASGNGDVSNYGIVLCNTAVSGCWFGSCQTPPCDQVHIRTDFDSFSQPKNTPNNYADDTWQGFWTNSHNLVFSSTCSNPAVNCCSGNCALCSAPNECLTRNRIFSLTFIPHWTDPVPYCALDIEIIGRYDPSRAASYDNPEVTLRTSVCPRSLSLR